MTLAGGGAGAAIRAMPSGAPYPVDRVRADFPILARRVHGRPLVYLDNAATAQKPETVIEAMTRYYRHDNANIHRGVHELSVRATEAYDAVRAKVRRFINAAEDREIVFVRGTTEAINLVARSFGRGAVGRGDEIVVSEMEHHSNIVPWQLLAEEVGARVRPAPVTDRGEIDLDGVRDLLGPRTRLVALTHVSNAIGTINPIEDLVALAHAHGIPVLVDGAQAVPHLPVDVGRLGCDFYAFSGHKMFGPTGIGVLYGRREFLEAMPPYQGGGGMIAKVSFSETTFAPIPTRFEAGTPAIAEVTGLGAAVEYLETIGYDAIGAYEADLLAYADERLATVSGLRVLGRAQRRAAVLSVVMDGIHPHDVGTVLDQAGVAVRAGHHCCQPLMDRFGVDATVRVSLALYNTGAEVDALIDGLAQARELFG